MTLGIGAGWEPGSGLIVILSDPRMSDEWKQLLALHPRRSGNGVWKETQVGYHLRDAGFLMQQVLFLLRKYSRERILGIRGMARTGPIFPKKCQKRRKNEVRRRFRLCGRHHIRQK